MLYVHGKVSRSVLHSEVDVTQRYISFVFGDRSFDALEDGDYGFSGLQLGGQRRGRLRHPADASHDEIVESRLTRSHGRFVGRETL